jgi:hypothetical protein
LPSDVNKARYLPSGEIDIFEKGPCCRRYFDMMFKIQVSISCLAFFIR